ncbi:MAG TPA: Uma2 family endonuclease [Tepidisphaeraceae bacterium]|nr:Uma2 family endonuclease [Tepidisphaeraceae bacterium]
MSRTQTSIGPEDHGRRMSLAEFDHAEVKEGHLYELEGGVIVASDVPKRKHLAQVMALRRARLLYDAARPGVIHSVAGGGECKLLIPPNESERHPDLTVYRTPPPPDEAIWSTWILEIVFEVVSPGSEGRDYHDKPGDYLAFGVPEYVIVDAEAEMVTVMTRAAQGWSRRWLRRGDVYETTQLEGFAVPVSQLLDAARDADER